MVTFGELYGHAIGPFVSYSCLVYISMILPVTFFLTFFWMPESPYWLLMKNRVEESKKNLIFLRRYSDESAVEKDIEEAAWSLGASQWQTFWRVVLPPLMPAMLTGIALAFSRAVGEYGSVVIVAANVPFKDLIASVLIIQRLEQYDYSGATVIGTVLLAISLLVLLVINLIQAWGRRYDA